jgi:hypothetical protein
MTAIEEQAQPVPVPARRRRRRVALVGASVAAAAAAGVIGLNLVGSAPAYAVTRHQDGSVTFVINDIRDAAGATRALQKAGVRAVVLVAKPAGGCAPGTAGVGDGGGYPSLKSAIEQFGYRRSHPQTPNAFVIYPAQIPQGDVLVIYGGDLPGGVGFLSTGMYRVPGPSCVELPPWHGPGAPGTMSPAPVPSASLHR